MGLLDNFEKKLDQMVNAPFQRAFKDVVQPVEIAAKLQQAMDTRVAIISRGRTVVPNFYTVELSPHDNERLAEIATTVRQELIGVLREHATVQRYTFQGSVDVVLEEDPTLDTGVFRVRSATKPDAHPPEPEPIVVAGYTGHPQLTVGEKTYQLTKSRTRIGRGVGADIAVEDAGVSRAHAEILLGNPTVIRDLGSTNGTKVDGRKVAESPLHDGAQITIGNTNMTYRSG